MQVLVTGGTGFIGTYLCEELADRGHDVTALARNPEDADVVADVETVRGDVTDPGSLMVPFEGQDAVVNLVALSPLFKPSGGDERHFEVHLRGTENSVEAAEANEVDRFVQMSALGADPDGPTSYIQAKGEAEQVVKTAPLDWVVFRPSVVFGDGGEFVPFTRKLAPPYMTPLPGGGRSRFQPIWVGDIVPMLADAVEGTTTGPHADVGEEAEGTTDGAATREPDEPGSESDETEGSEDTEATDAVGETADASVAASESDAADDPHVGRTYEIGGPEVLTLADVAELAWAAEGKPVSVVPVPMALARVGLTVLDAIPGAPMGGDQYRSLQFDNTTGRNAVEAFDYREADLRTLADYLGVDEAEIRR
jgi:NADH dehydrogenase